MSVSLPRPEGALPEDFHVSRRAIASLLFSGYAAAAVSANASPIVTNTEGLITETVTIKSGAETLPVYVARPSAPGRHAAVIVVSEIFGVHEYIRDTARRFAKLGYVAIAPNFFFRADPANTLPSLKAFPEILKIVGKTPNEQVMADVRASLDWLKANPHVDPHKLAITGFCWGGAVVWGAAERFSDLKAGAAWYGRLKPPAPGQPLSEPGRVFAIEGVRHLKAPVIGFYGGQDKSIPPADVEEMRAALKAAGKSGSELFVYPEAGHGFHADYRDGYDEAAAKDAFAKLLAFFKAHGVGA